MVNCAVPGCNSSQKENPQNYTFHTLPKDIEVKQKWLKMIDRNDWVPKKFSKICSKHFEPKCFSSRGVARVKLHSGSVPTLFMPVILKPKRKPSTYIYRDISPLPSSSTNVTGLDNTPKRKKMGASSRTVASSSSVRQNVLPAATSDTDSCDDDEATTSPQHITTNNDPLQITSDITKEGGGPDDDQLMEQVILPIENVMYVEPKPEPEPDIKEEPVEDTTCEFDNSVTVLSHVPKSTAEAEELKTQLEAKTSLVEMYKNEVNDLQQKNYVLQEKCEKLTKLLKKSLTKSPCKEIGTEFKKILSHPQDNVENYRKKEQLKESQFKAKIKMLLESIEESQQLLEDKQKQWEAKENDFIQKINQLEHNLQDLQKGQVDNQSAQFLQNNNILLEKKEREWLEKERKWLEHLEVKETQWLEKERLWREQVEERDRHISRLQNTRLKPLVNNR